MSQQESSPFKGDKRGSRHRVKILRPRGEDEEGAFGTGEEALALGLFGDGFLLEMDEGEAAVDGDVLHIALAGGDEI